MQNVYIYTTYIRSADAGGNLRKFFPSRGDSFRTLLLRTDKSASRIAAAPFYLLYSGTRFLGIQRKDISLIIETAVSNVDLNCLRFERATEALGLKSEWKLSVSFNHFFIYFYQRYFIVRQHFVRWLTFKFGSSDC